jgi:hypothetical protein
MSPLRGYKLMIAFWPFSGNRKNLILSQDEEPEMLRRGLEAAPKLIGNSLQGTSRRPEQVLFNRIEGYLPT